MPFFPANATMFEPLSSAPHSCFNTPMKSKKVGRRDFLKRAGLAAPLLLGNPSALAMGKAPAAHNHLIKPERLRTGDVIGIVAPASPANGPDDVDRFAAVL